MFVTYCFTYVMADGYIEYCLRRKKAVTLVNPSSYDREKNRRDSEFWNNANAIYSINVHCMIYLNVYNIEIFKWKLIHVRSFNFSLFIITIGGLVLGFYILWQFLSILDLKQKPPINKCQILQYFKILGSFYIKKHFLKIFFFPDFDIRQMDNHYAYD